MREDSLQMRPVEDLRWIDLVAVSRFCTSRPDFSGLERGFSSRCHTWELDAEFSFLSRADFSVLVIVRSAFQLVPESPGRMTYPNPTWEIDSRFILAISNSLPSISPTQVLLLVLFAAWTSSTLYWNFQ